MDSKDLVINSKPTKDLILGMLTRDVKLVSAVLDLVDNSVDGARRLKPDENPGAHVMKKSARLKGLKVELEVKSGHFFIKDNCGGIDETTLKQYAFRFGRLREDDRDPSELGAFGVGMKRAMHGRRQPFNRLEPENLGWRRRRLGISIQATHQAER